MTTRYFLIYDIEWNLADDVDDADYLIAHELPKSQKIWIESGHDPDDTDEEGVSYVANQLAETSGYCVEEFKWVELDKENYDRHSTVEA